MVRRLLAALVILLGASSQARPQAARPVDFSAEVKPILDARCLSCHGPDAQKSGLRVDLPANLLRGGDSGEPGVVPGASGESVLYLAVSGGDPDRKMPPKGGPLTAAQVEVIRAWIDQGAAMPAPDAETVDPASPDLWSLKPLRADGPPPAVDPANPVDAFIRARLAGAGLKASPRAEPRALVRRVHLVVLGLPPTPGEVERFLHEDELAPEAAYTRLIDDVLSRPQFGERWAQHWLDLVRWAETWGYETNSERPNSWPYRDWLIRAFNDDLPFDEFVFRQLAGDTVADDAATGMLVAGPANLPGQIGKDEESMRQARQDELDETVKTVSGAFLGLTVGCARCHNHKFDPVSQRDYYATQAVFAGMKYGHRRLRGPENERWAAEAGRVREKLASTRAAVEAKRVALKLGPAVSPEGQSDEFAPVLARSVRVNIRATSDGSNPSLYELQVWSAASGSEGPTNLALGSAGGKASASSFALENQTRHPDNLTDGLGRDGGRYPWKADAAGPAWVKIDLARPATIERVVWERGFEGFPADYEIEVERPDGGRVVVGHSRGRVPHPADRRPAEKVVLDGVTPEETAELVALLATAREAEATVARLSLGPQTFGGTFGAPDPTYRLNRGDPMQRREEVSPDALAVLGSLGLTPAADDPARRSAYARWLTAPDNPLTRRVTVNRLWQQTFGTGLVDTPADFGRMGSPPTHPELLDWLAAEFLRNGGSVKGILRLLLTSETFRQSTAADPAAVAKDAETRLLWRFPPRRVEAEVIRDAILRASGDLNPRMYGQGFDFFNQRGGLTDYTPREAAGPGDWRRMVYATKVRMQTADVFGAFDCPDAGQMTPQRSRSTTPVQALGLFNGGFIGRQSRSLARRVAAEAGPETRAQVSRAFALTLGRPPTPGEASALAALAERHGPEHVGRVLFNTNEFVYLP